MILQQWRRVSTRLETRVTDLTADNAALQAQLTQAQAKFARVEKLAAFAELLALTEKVETLRIGQAFLECTCTVTASGMTEHACVCCCMATGRASRSSEPCAHGRKQCECVRLQDVCAVRSPMRTVHD